MAFMQGMELCERFYHDGVRPVLDRRFPGLAHAAALLDRGSDVLGFDTPQSMDHHWGPRMTLFLSEGDCEKFADQIKEALANELPREICGYATHFENPAVDGGVLRFAAHGPICHKVSVMTAADFFASYLGFNPLERMWETDWLVTPQQRLRTIASGKVFHDDLGELAIARELLSWYPRDVWLYLLACQWRRIAQEEPFMARCGDTGDELGSRIVASRMVTEIMRLCFLMEKQYAPYFKWLGTAFSRLRCAPDLTPIFHAVFDAGDWKERERQLSQAYIHVAAMHNGLHLTGEIPAEVSKFHSRPYQVLHSERFVDALRACIRSEAVLCLPSHLGAVWQYADSTDLLDRIPKCRQLHVLY